MFIVGAVNVFPSDVEYVVRAEKGLTGEYLIRVYDENFSTRYEVSVERAQGSDEPFDAVAARVTAALKAHTGVKPASSARPPSTRRAASSTSAAARSKATNVQTDGRAGRFRPAIGYHSI